LEEIKMMTIVITDVADVKNMEYKELQTLAKEFGIKANQKKDVLVALCEAELQKLDDVCDELDETDVDAEFEKYMNGDAELVEDSLEDTFDQEESASEASATEEPADEEEDKEDMDMDDVVYTKVFEFVRSSNLGVVFHQKGVQIKIGWSIHDARSYIKIGDGDKRIMSIQTAIDKFKKFTNGVHGDIAQIVKGLVRVRKMPAQVIAKKKERERQQRAERAALHNQAKDQENVSPETSKENPSRPRYSGTVDASWLAEFREMFYVDNDRQPTGYEIKEAWSNRIA
jgi:hypothetical protein